MKSIPSFIQLSTFVLLLTFVLSQATVLKGPPNQGFNGQNRPKLPDISALSAAVGFTGLGQQPPQNGPNSSNYIYNFK
jgi:hypothetical protein